MKKISLLLGILASSALVSLGQDAKGGQTLAEVQSVKKDKPEKKPAVTPPKPTDQILGKKVVYGGYLTDFARAEKKRPLFNLKAPIDPQKDVENISYYPGTDKVQGVILFSIKF